MSSFVTLATSYTVGCWPTDKLCNKSTTFHKSFNSYAPNP